MISQGPAGTGVSHAASMRVQVCRLTPASRILMIRPACFGPNASTAPSNAFQRLPNIEAAVLHNAVLAEFSTLVDALDRAGVQVFVADDTPVPPKPDAVFPNNWVSFHADGRVILYPMEAANRRTERRLDILEDLARAGWIALDRILDLSSLETAGHYLEGTGSLVLDRAYNRAYVGLSSRSHPLAIARFERETGIEVRVFTTSDACGRPLYHTNVMLSLGERFAVVCLDAVCGDAERAILGKELEDSGRELILISLAQMERFAGNIIELATSSGGRVIVMSESARAVLEAPQLQRVASFGDVLSVPIPMIEAVGGGSARCMIAEVFP